MNYMTAQGQPKRAPRQGRAKLKKRVEAGMAEPASSSDLLRESERMYRGLIEGLPAAFYTTNVDGYLTFYNEAAATLWGRRPVLGKERWCGSWKLYGADGALMPHDCCPMAITLKENRPIRCKEVLAERPDGTRVTFIPHPTPLRNVSGKLIGATNMLVDITERKQAEQALQRQAGLIDLSFDAIFVWSKEGGIHFWSKGATQLYGYESSEVQGIVPHELFKTGFASPWLQIETELREHGLWEGELHRTTKTNREAIVSSRLQLVSGSGVDTVILETDRDITERRRLEQELLDISGAEQRRIGQDLHDGLCQHLAGIEFRTSVLVDQLASCPKAQQEAAKIGELIRDGARQARMLSRGLSPVSLETHGLMSALKELTENTSDLFNNTCRFECGKPISVEDNIVATHLYRIAQEAISNAAATRPRRDNSGGPPQDRQRDEIEHYGRWLRTPRASGPIRRNGLAHHALSRGTDRSGPHDRASQRRRHIRDVRPPKQFVKKPSRNSRKTRILIVDDHPMTRSGLAYLINHQPDMTTCCEAENAAAALEGVIRTKPDLVLTDFALPDRNGLELIKDIKAFQPQLPVLVISMHEETLYAERVLRAGARGYITKEEGGDRLMQAIRHVLRGTIYVSDTMSARILEIFSGGQATHERSPVEELSDREFEIFESLGRRSLDTTDR